MANILLISLLPLSVLYLCIFYLRARSAHQRRLVLDSLSLPSSTKAFAFFHPYCNAGGGGERVLWTAIAYIQRTHPDLLCVVYTGDTSATKSSILEKIESRFSITLSPATLHFVFLTRRKLVEDSTYPHFTLIGQSLGSVGLALEALSLFVPDAYIDTMGYAFTLPLVRLLGIPAGAYVHYPTVSPPMIARAAAHPAKRVYYHAFMLLYALALRRARVLMVNSSWTKTHVDAVLAYPPFGGRWGVVRSRVVYPACDTREMARLPLTLGGRGRMVLSIAQFRPEKEHAKQVRALYVLLKEYPEYTEQGIRLVMIGGCRNAEDEARVEVLRKLARELSVEAHVEFVLNAPYPDMLAWLGRASVGLNTMLDEHFGINVVEFMAAGVIPIAHASGGPLEDIVVKFQGQPTGYHAKTPEEFASRIHEALTLSPEEDLAIRQRARTWAVQRFSEAEFEAAWEASEWWSKLLA
ncbi:mannosyltransferase [Mycena albidolilacea]|uniref:GDP-Man:Man(3)GlcNAc(2)-PP-Dol alpha-1,2-mannosyltransferase n=1 Tax=Mycena albidolilacea TaxID=1033008 RepID=A0AAD7A7C1_9AGAR|nr:mannosyltransferase [Mycena albidolilacea]